MLPFCLDQYTVTGEKLSKTMNFCVFLLLTKSQTLSDGFNIHKSIFLTYYIGQAHIYKLKLVISITFFQKVEIIAVVNIFMYSIYAMKKNHYSKEPPPPKRKKEEKEKLKLKSGNNIVVHHLMSEFRITYNFLENKPEKKKRKKTSHLIRQYRQPPLPSLYVYDCRHFIQLLARVTYQNLLHINNCVYPSVRL